MIELLRRISYLWNRRRLEREMAEEMAYRGSRGHRICAERGITPTTRPIHEFDSNSEGFKIVVTAAALVLLLPLAPISEHSSWPAA